MAVPGHTLGHLAYHAPGALFCGDTLFGAGCGRLFEGSPEQMSASLDSIAALPDDTLVYCAHEYTEMNLRFAQAVEPENAVLRARVAKVAALRAAGLPSVPLMLSEEKATNPFLRCAEPAVIAAAEKQNAAVDRKKLPFSKSSATGGMILGFGLTNSGADFGQRIKHAGGIEGFDNEAAGAVHDRLLNGFRIGIAGHHDHFGCRMGRLDFA